MEGFFKGIGQLGIFMICAQAIAHFRPNAAYEKYMKLLISTMLLVQIFLPFTRLFALGKTDIEGQIADFEQQVQESMEQAAAAAADTEYLLDHMTLEEVRERLAQTEQQRGEGLPEQKQEEQAAEWQGKESPEQEEQAEEWQRKESRGQEEQVVEWQGKDSPEQEQQTGVISEEIFIEEIEIKLGE